MGKSNDYPDSPDYAAAAEAQGAANKDAFLSAIQAQRINQSNPYGSSQWTYNGSAVAPTMDSYMAKVGTQQEQAIPGIDAGMFSSDPQMIMGTYTEDMAREDYNKAMQEFQIASMANPGDWSLETTLSPEMQAIYDQGYDAYLKAFQQQQANPLDTSGLTAGGDWSMLTNALTGGSDAYSKAYYDQATSLLGDKYAAEEQAMRSQLLNSGLTEGTEAYDREMNDWLNAKNANYSNIANQSILTGSTLKNQDINSLVSALSAQDQARAGQLQEATYMYNQPMATAQTFLSGLQVPQFSGSSGGGSYQGEDILGALNNQYNADMNAANADAAQQQNLINTLMQAGMTGALWLSDRRLKSNIKSLGRKTSLGIPLYSYTIFGKDQVGVMADEAREIVPDSVLETPSGYLMVDYSKVGGV